MSDLAQLITSIAALLGVCGTLFISLRNSRKIEQVHIATNGMKDHLVAVTAAASKAEGNLEGRAELKQEQKDR